MLRALRVRDFAIIENLELEFDSGFTVLTGETGAGKSILVDALTLALGGRASSELIRSAASEAEVEALFELNPDSAPARFLYDSGLAAGSGPRIELAVRRVISKSGRNRVWLNGKMETTARLFELGRLLVDIYGQHEHQGLLKEENHLQILDAFAGLKSAREEFSRAYQELQEAEKRLKQFEQAEREKSEREDLLRFRIQEIEKVAPRPGEEQELAAERERLKNADLLRSAAAFAADYLYESDDAVISGLARVLDRLREAGRHDPELLAQADLIDQAAALIEEAARSLSHYADKVEADPQQLAKLEDRLYEIRGLKRKYQASEEELIELLENSRRELSLLERSEQTKKELERQVETARARAESKASELSKARARAGKELARKVMEELKALGMEKTRFETRLEKRELGPLGADRVEFFISPNPGHPPKPLSRIASGGELSRIMLALRILPVEEGDVETLVFDEVDEGIGGAVAEAVGRRMKSLARDHQVLCVTHLPQIAALADHHFRVEKKQDKDRTRVAAAKLDHEQRIEELARMLGGLAITDTTRAHARELLERSAQAPGAGSRAGKKAPPKRGRRR